MNKERSAIAPLSALELVHDRHAKKKKKTKLRGSGIPIVLLRKGPCADYSYIG